jgi:hypothetical protein
MIYSYLTPSKVGFFLFGLWLITWFNNTRKGYQAQRGLTKDNHYAQGGQKRLKGPNNLPQCVYKLQVKLLRTSASSEEVTYAGILSKKRIKVFGFEISPV